MWLVSDKPLTLLAPMDGYTDSPFRQMVKKIEPQCVVFTEFISARELARSKDGPKKHLSFDSSEQPLVVQLYGKDPADFAWGAHIAESAGAAGIDINMGCPSKKVVAHSHGSALMQDIDLACSIVEQVKSAVSIPVTVKTRLGWNHSRDLIPFALKLQDAGLDGITIHGRTYAQKFEGTANWLPIYDLKNQLQIPVFGNGDILSAQQALTMVQDLNGVMVGRAAMMYPWLVQKIHAALHSRSLEPFIKVPLVQQTPAWLEFLQKTIELRGEIGACRRFRRYLVHMVKEWSLPFEIRQMAIQVKTLTQVEAVLDNMANEV